MRIKHKIIMLGIAVSSITAIPVYSQMAKIGLREQIVLDLFQQSMRDQNYTQAYFHVKYIEKNQNRDQAFWAYNKLKCLIHIANFNEKNSPFVDELRSTIIYLQQLNGNKGLNKQSATNNAIPQHLQPKEKLKTRKDEFNDLDIKALNVASKSKQKEDDNSEEEENEEEDFTTEDDEATEEEHVDDENNDEVNATGGKIKLSGNVPKLEAETTVTDMYWVHTIQMNYLQEGERIKSWQNDPDYDRGIGYFQKNNYEKAYEYLYQSLSRNNGLAYLTLGQMAEKGYGMPADIGRAAAYFEQAAELHIGPAYLSLAEYLRKDGNNTLPLNELSADELKDYVAYLQQAAELNVAKAKYLLAQYFLDGPNQENKKQNAITAFEWMSKAAADGLTEAQYMMAVMHCKGVGTIRSHGEAQYWITLLSQSNTISSQRIVELQDCIKDL